MKAVYIFKEMYETEENMDVCFSLLFVTLHLVLVSFFVVIGCFVCLLSSIGKFNVIVVVDPVVLRSLRLKP